MQALGDFCIGTFNEVTFCGNKLASKKKVVFLRVCL